MALMHGSVVLPAHVRMDQYEKHLIQAGFFELVHRGSEWEYYTSRPLREGANGSQIAAPDAGGGEPDGADAGVAPTVSGPERWYRHMNREEFQHLLQNNQLAFVDSKAYTAISKSREYCAKYIHGVKRNGQLVTHLVQFELADPSMDLDAIFAAYASERGIRRLTPKPEDGAVTWGLGPQSRGGMLGECFNSLMASGQVRFELVELRVQRKGKSKR